MLDIINKVEQSIKDNDLNNSLILLEEVLSTLSCEINRSIFIDTPKIDNLCQDIGKKILEGITDNISRKETNKKLNVYITGAVYINGGHTREIEDWINNVYDDRENILIITSPSRYSSKGQLEKLASSKIQVIVNDKIDDEDKVNRIIWLQQQLMALRPEVIFVSTTNTDVISLAALQPQIINKLYWNLSLDHGVSIGLHLKGITKIIVKRPYLYFYLKDKLRLNNLAYVPFNRPDFVKQISNYDTHNDFIITASCASSSHKIEIPYAHKFTEVIANILKITNGQHFHIGDISQAALDDLYREMDKLGVNRENFIRIKFVSNLSQVLIENKIDILIQTFPIPGGLVTIEAMQAGKMIINNRHYASYLMNLSDFCYDGAFNWLEVEELYKFLQNLNREEIIRQDKLSREHYEKYNKSENLKKIMDVDNFLGLDIENKRESIAHEYSGYALDYCQKYFDDMAVLLVSGTAKRRPINAETRFIKTCRKLERSLLKKIKNVKKLFNLKS